MDNKILVSVVVPVFNAAAYLGPCLDSLLNQKLQDLEIICIEDASTDGSSALLAEYARQDPRIRVHINAKNIGAGPCRNIGIHAARGAYLQFADADDLVPPDALQSLYELAEHSRCVAVRGTLAIFPQGPVKQWLEERCAACLKAPEREFFLFCDEPATSIPWFHTSYLFLRAFLTAHRLEYPNLRDGEDPVFLAAVLAKARYVSATSHTCYLYRGVRPGHRITKSHLLDQLQHIRLVRDIFARSFPGAWTSVCSEFYLKLVREMLEEDAPTLAETVNSALRLVSQIWRPDELARAGVSADMIKRAGDAGEPTSNSRVDRP